MRLNVKLFDGRSKAVHQIIDEDTNLSVGYVHCHGTGFVGTARSGRGDIDVSLFGGKYSATFHSRDECCAFIKGVQAALRRVGMLTDSAEGYLPGYSVRDVSAA
jgi:hypothetical protein